LLPAALTNGVASTGLWAWGTLMSSLLGVELPTPVNFIIAFVFVLLLIGAAAWLVRRFGATRIDAAARPQPARRRRRHLGCSGGYADRRRANS
jgi:hypothetical protein